MALFFCFMIELDRLKFHEKRGAKQYNPLPKKNENNLNFNFIIWQRGAKQYNPLPKKNENNSNFNFMFAS